MRENKKNYDEHCYYLYIVFFIYYI